MTCGRRRTSKAPPLVTSALEASTYSLAEEEVALALREDACERTPREASRGRAPGS